MSAPPVLDRRHCYLAADEIEVPPLSLPRLFAAGVECGHTEAREELKRRVEAVDAQLGEYRAIRDRAQDDREVLAMELFVAQREHEREQLGTQIHLGKLQTQIGQLELAVGAARARIGTIESSTTWRASAPLRSSVHRVKMSVERARSSWIAARQYPRYARIAWTMMRNEGPAAVAQRIARRIARPNHFTPRPGLEFSQEREIAPLAFPPAAQPRVTIAIPVYGKPVLTYTCLKSVHSCTPTGTYEVLILDDASPESSSKSR